MGTAALTGSLTNFLTQAGQIYVTGGRESFNGGEVAVSGALSGITGGAGTAVLRAGAARAVSLNASQSLNLGENLIFQAHQLTNAARAAVQGLAVGTQSALRSGASELLSDPPPYAGPPDSFNRTFVFPSTEVFDPVYGAYCSPKCP